MKASPNNIHAALEPDGWFESLTCWQMTAKLASRLLGCPAGAARLSHPALWPVLLPIPARGRTSSLGACPLYDSTRNRLLNCCKDVMTAAS